MTERCSITRLYVVAVFLCLALLGVTSRLAYLHLQPDSEARNKADRIRRFKKELVGSRGRILDGSPARNILAMNLAVKDVCIDPSEVAQRGQSELVVQELSESLCVPMDQIRERLGRKESKFAYVRRFVPEDQVEPVARMKLPGVFFQDSYARNYPQGAFMCHILGFANVEGVGAAGVEQVMDRFLRGAPGLVESRLDGRRHEMYSQRTREIAPQAGTDICLSIDQNAQYMLEKALQQAVDRHQARGAWGIVQRVRTGEILAMACLPTYDLNAFREAPDDRKLNRAIGYVYEPGSVMKAVTIAAALNEGVVTPSTVFDCESGSWLYQGKILRDFHPYGNLTVADIVKKSSNIGSAKIALLLGEQRLDQYMRAFNMGRPLGIDLPGEEGGILPPLARWSRLSCSRIAIGQGIAVTALQMLGVYAAIANDGFLMKPHVVQRAVKPDGETLYQAELSVLSRPIRGETAAIMRGLLGRVTEEGGTGTKAAIPGYRVAGKTGTAQKAVAGGYSESAYMSSFVGFLPTEQPEVGIIIVVDEPQPLHTGGIVAAPAFREVAEQLVRYLDIPPGAPAVGSAGPLVANR